MVLKAKGLEADLKEITRQTYTPGSKGSFSIDMISAVRRRGLLGVPIRDLTSLLTEVAAGHPVIVFQNLWFPWMPNWHYAVAVGYDLTGPDLILHSGKDKFDEMDMRLFERSWSMTQYWGLLVLSPGEMAASVDDLGHVSAISGLEQTGKFEEALKGYEAVIAKWPTSLPALIGLGNVHFEKKNFARSVQYLLEATKSHVGSSVAWHNLATAQGAAGKIKDAQVSARQALSLAEGSDLEAYKTSLKAYLP